MDDRLVWLLRSFELRARVFNTGLLCRRTDFDAGEGLGYIHVMRAGTMRVENPHRNRFQIDEPAVLFYMNPTRHRLVPGREGAELVCASFEFGAGLLNPLAAALPEPLLIPIDALPTLQMALDLLFREAFENHCGRQAILDRMMEIIIILLLRDLMDQQRLELGLLAGLADPGLARAINAMHRDPARAWSLDDLAVEAGMSRARFAARFRDTVGTTPGAYLTEWRLGLAQSLLIKGKSVQLVSEQVGYSNASALSRAFVARLGLSPTEWLKSRAGHT